MISDSSDLLLRLHSLSYDNPSRDPWWWPRSGRFETLIGAILTQNTAWQNVEIAITNLSKAGLLEMHALCRVPQETLEELVRPSGYFRNKARNLIALTQAIENDFGTFEEFQTVVSRDWLMAQRGIGNETADAILNYACYREAMVVDSYTARLLEALGQSKTDYAGVQQWMTEGVEAGCRQAFPNLPLAQCYARYHGMVVEYAKANRKGKEILAAPLEGR